MSLHLIAARAKNNVIGAGPDIPWQAKGEQKLFREITTGGTLIMGRKTFESIGKPLPGRETIIVTRNILYQHEGCHVADDLPKAIALAEPLGRQIFVAGGGQIYAQALPLATDIHLTTIETLPEGDVFFPDFDASNFHIVAEQSFSTNLQYTYQHFRRNSAGDSHAI